MEFKVETSAYFYENESDIEKLKSIGFHFEEGKYGKAIKGDVTIEIKTIEELVEFTNRFGQIIVSDGEIEIYNDYRE